ncbi:putative transcriptional regulator|uniref:Putative transcriptional regulator n=1 Tax=Brenneria salicis ATCC 15712 = DSM 30166 TaxID=714314 RepID=A0A366I422_9GAMM|nr:helix-turn-helix domain-containing protein [Brenneria salicis]NMN91451.1 putative transcriptional regulator [Brenneria salicis ATCC 15712 = DSM 30166]RBP62699.1 putative transcriptional regulator [Brenneria salicis ATCC 15712 = DSM 30166]RLM30666.1 transcriptional regulator [Brenneria salicis ATCC 15712 = DSM 30166]
MTTLKVGIADPEEMKARTLRIARGEEKPSPSDPTTWFASTESFARILSAPNREMLRIIAEQAPDSLDELAALTDRAKSNLSRTLKTMIGYGLIRMERSGRKLAPKLIHDRVVLDLPLKESRKRTATAVGDRS